MPCSVGIAPRVLRSKSLIPRRASRAAMRLLKVDCLIRIASAAREKFWASAVATANLSWRTSIIGYATFIIFSPAALSPIIRITQIFPMSSITSGQDRCRYKHVFELSAPINSLWVISLETSDFLPDVKRRSGQDMLADDQ